MQRLFSGPGSRHRTVLVSQHPSPKNTPGSHLLSQRLVYITNSEFKVREQPKRPRKNLLVHFHKGAVPENNRKSARSSTKEMKSPLTPCGATGHCTARSHRTTHRWKILPSGEFVASCKNLSNEQDKKGPPGTRCCKLPGGTRRLRVCCARTCSSLSKLDWEKFAPNCGNQTFWIARTGF